MAPKLPPGVTVKNGRYYRVQTLPGRKQKWHKLTRVSDGVAAMYRALADLDMDAAPSGTGIPDRLTVWLQIALPGLSASEQKETARMAGVISTAFQDFKVHQVKTHHIHEFLHVNFVLKDKARTAQRYRAILAKFFRWSIIQDERQDNPVDAIRLKAPPTRDRYITDAEYCSIRDAMLIGLDGRQTASGPMMQIFVDLCYLTGQRSTEIRRLRWAQIDEAAGCIRFKPSKTAKSSGLKINVPITHQIAEVLARAKTLMRTKARLSPYVVHTQEGGQYTAHGIGSAWERACKRAGVTGATVKDIRPKSAMDAEEAGYSMEDIQTTLAHEDTGTTRIYLKKRSAKTSKVELTLPKGKKTDGA